ncbi:MAG: Ig-like domain-containing protein, partial [Acidobacteriota bacterium]|nr:Ig-like domain-containing protein [Acidobacteriota bacterium]
MLATFALFGCGGGSSSTTLGPVATVEMLPANASLDIGGTLGLSVTLKDAAGHQLLTPTVTFSSSNPLVQVANNGLLCAGTWDSLTTPIVCGPPFPAVGTAQVTATAGGVTGAPLTVFVHQHVDSITLTPANPACVTQGATVQYTATAFHGATDISSTVGGFNFNVGNVSVATINTADQPTGQPNNQITAKAAGSGLTNVVANSSGTTSLGASFTTCGPATITLHVTGLTDTTFSIAAAATKQLVADVVDTTGATITGLTLTYGSSSPAATVSAAGLVSGLAPGQATISASCTPPVCNAGVNTTVYSNPVVVTVTGTAAATKVFVTSTHFDAPTPNANPVVIPITTDTNTAGTAIAIPDITINNVATKSFPNSMLVTQGGSKVYIGSSNGMAILDTATNTITGTITSTPGRVVSISPNAAKVVIADTVNSKTYIYDTQSQAFETLPITGVTAVGWTPDGFKAYLVAGTTLYQYATGQISLRTIPIGDTGVSVDVFPGGRFAYLATASGNLGARATCRNDSTYAPEATLTTDGGLQFVRGVTLVSGLAAVPKMLDVGGVSMTVDTPTIGAPAATTDCPPSIAIGPASANWGGFGIAAFAPRQLITLSNGTQAYVTSDQAVLLGYDVVGNTTFTVPVGGVSQFTGGALPDSSKVYVGASDGAVHVIDTATRLQTATVPINFTGATACAGAVCAPDLVVV